MLQANHFPASYERFYWFFCTIFESSTTKLPNKYFVYINTKMGLLCINKDNKSQKLLIEEVKFFIVVNNCKHGCV